MEDGALHCRQQARAATDPCRHFPAQPLLEGRHHRLQGDHPHPIVLIFPHIVGAEKEAMTAQKTGALYCTLLVLMTGDFL